MITVGRSPPFCVRPQGNLATSGRKKKERRNVSGHLRSHFGSSRCLARAWLPPVSFFGMAGGDGTAASDYVDGYVLEGVRASVMTIHAAAGLAAASRHKLAERLLRTAEGLVRSAVSQLQASRAGADGGGGVSRPRHRAPGSLHQDLPANEDQHGKSSSRATPGQGTSRSAKRRRRRRAAAAEAAAKQPEDVVMGMGKVEGVQLEDVDAYIEGGELVGMGVGISTAVVAHGAAAASGPSSSCGANHIAVIKRALADAEALGGLDSLCTEYKKELLNLGSAA